MSSYIHRLGWDPVGRENERRRQIGQGTRTCRPIPSRDRDATSWASCCAARIRSAPCQEARRRSSCHGPATAPCCGPRGQRRRCRTSGGLRNGAPRADAGTGSFVCGAGIERGRATAARARRNGHLDQRATKRVSYRVGGRTIFPCAGPDVSQSFQAGGRRGGRLWPATARSREAARGGNAVTKLADEAPRWINVAAAGWGMTQRVPHIRRLLAVNGDTSWLAQSKAVPLRVAPACVCTSHVCESRACLPSELPRLAACIAIIAAVLAGTALAGPGNAASGRPHFCARQFV